MFDSDTEIFRVTGRKPSEIIINDGEEKFRSIETEVLKELGRKSGIILATGGGCVTREENYEILHQNGTVVRVERNIDKLATNDRPLSAEGLKELAEKREKMYSGFADFCVKNDKNPKDAAERILSIMNKGEFLYEK